MSSELRMVVGSARLTIVQGDITDRKADAILNAGNSSLMGGGGVDGAIHRRGGPTILKECQEIRKAQWRDGLPPGEAVITGAGRLKARFVIHTVGPVWYGGGNNEERVLTNCYANSLKLADSRGVNSIAFPAISTGAYGYPIRGAGAVALNTVRDFLLNRMGKTTLNEVIFVLFAPRDFEAYEQLAKSMLGGSNNFESH